MLILEEVGRNGQLVKLMSIGKSSIEIQRRQILGPLIFRALRLGLLVVVAYVLAYLTLSRSNILFMGYYYQQHDFTGFYYLPVPLDWMFSSRVLQIVNFCAYMVFLPIQTIDGWLFGHVNVWTDFNLPSDAGT